MVRSGVVDYKAPFILKRDFSPNFPLRLMLKDIRLALDAAKESRVRLPGLEAVEEVYDVAAEEGQAGSGLRRDPHAAGKMGGRGSETQSRRLNYRGSGTLLLVSFIGAVRDYWFRPLWILLRQRPNVVHQVPHVVVFGAVAFWRHFALAMANHVEEFAVGAVFQRVGIGEIRDVLNV
jgi:hypothetical protein